MTCNQAVVCGKITKLGILRYTPAGVAVVEFTVNHTSTQIEAGVTRQIMCDIFVIALGQLALSVTEFKIGSMVKLTGFLNKKSYSNQQIVLHADHIVLI